MTKLVFVCLLLLKVYSAVTVAVEGVPQPEGSDV